MSEPRGLFDEVPGEAPEAGPGESGAEAAPAEPAPGSGGAPADSRPAAPGPRAAPDPARVPEPVSLADRPDRAAVHARSRAADAADEAALARPPEPRHAAPEDADERPVPLRLSHLHLRMGSLGLARAELESLAGRGMLDDAALLDLAEVRWRTGDLAGAGEAANALLSRGRGDTLALVIAAESVSAQGRPGEARRLAGRALEGHEGPLEPLFAGIPKSLIWPAESPTEVLPEAADAGEPIAAAREGAGAPVRTASQPASTGAAEAFAGGRAALGAGDTLQAALRLGVALRLEPGYARDVLVAIGEAASDPALALVAGDALRLLGRESEALAAFDIARGHVHSSEEPHVRREAEPAPDHDELA